MRRVVALAVVEKMIRDRILDEAERKRPGCEGNYISRETEQKIRREAERVVHDRRIGLT